MTPEQIQARVRALLKIRSGQSWTMDHETGDITWDPANNLSMPTEDEITSAALEVWRDEVWAEFRAKRDMYLERLSGIAGRADRAGNSSLALAADTMSEALLALPEHANVQSAATPTRAALELAILNRYKAMVVTALGDPPDLSRKATFDKVFK